MATRRASLSGGLVAAAGAILWICGCSPAEGDVDPYGSGGSAAGASGGSGGTPTGSGGASATGGQSGAGSGGRATTGTGGAAGRAGTGGRPGGSGGSSGAAGAGPYRLEFVGNITTGNAVDTDGKVFSRHWDQITPENAGKWGSVQTSAGAAFNWRTLDAIYDYAQQNNLIFKQHAFVWGSQQPTGSINETAVKTWMREFCGRYPNTKLIDVVNEPPPHTTPSYVNAIGGGTDGTWQWVTNAFLWAREACPDAILILNDFNNIEWSNDINHFLGIVRAIKAAGAPIDAIGAQAHDLDYGPPITPASVRSNLARVHSETQLPIYVTEMDFSFTDDNQQLQSYQQFFPMLRDSGYVRGITIWGWIYGRTWASAPNSGLIRNGTARPAMTWLMEQLGRPNP
jgi:endo-1,4-beta-xylanase